jgi:hypothetical protein
MGGPEELERNAASAYGTDHRSHFKRRFTFAKRQLQIENVVRMDLGLALDDTAAHREIEHRSLTANLTSRKREKESHGNAKVFASVYRMRGMVQSKTGCQKTMTARWATEWRHEEEGSEALPYRLWMRPQWAILLALRTT